MSVHSIIVIERYPIAQPARCRDSSTDWVLVASCELALVEVIRRSHRSLQFSGRGILSGTPCIATYSSCQSRSGKHSRRTGMRQALLQCCGSSRKLSRGTAAHKLCNSVNCRCGHCRSGYSLWVQLPSQAQCGAQQEYQSVLGDRLENRSCIPNFCRLEHLLPINRYHAHSASFFHLPAFFFRDAARGYTKFLYCLRAPIGTSASDSCARF